MATLRLVKTEPRSPAPSSSEPNGPLLETTQLLSDWLATEFTSTEDATADLARRVADRLLHRDEEINRLAHLLWESTRTGYL